MVWMDSWQRDKDGDPVKIPAPPLTVPVPVKPGGAPPQQAPAAVAGPQESKKIDFTVFQES